MPRFSTFETESHSATSVPNPDVAGVCHLDSLLERCLGDAPLATRLWRRFGERLAKAIGEIEHALAEVNHSDALRRVHSLKGEAASLAAHRLQQAATDLESALKSEPGDRKDEIARLLVALRTAAEQCQDRVPQIIEALALLVVPAT